MAEDVDDDDDDVIALMRKRLPQYVVNCFLAAGFDVSEVISKMVTNEEPGNSIEQIEKFIENHYSSHPDYCNTPLSVVKPFIFPPGHRLRICNFVSEVKQTSLKQLTFGQGARKRRKMVSSYTSSSQVRPADSDTDSDVRLSVSSISKHIKANISKWVNGQQEKYLKSLKENRHFSIIVTNVAKSNVFSVSVKCSGCDQSIRLQQKDKDNMSPFLISNWTRHVKKCKKLMKIGESSQQSLKKFLPSTDLSSSFDTSSTSYSSPTAEHSITTEVTTSDEEVSMSPPKQVLLGDESSKQVFHDAPPSPLINTEGGANQQVTDWSRQARIKRKLTIAANDIDQACITDYFSVLDEIEYLSRKNTELAELLTMRVQEEKNTCSFTPILRQIVSNAERNAERLPKGRRHLEVLKKFSTSLFIYAGPLAYEFLHKNMPEALPSLSTIRNIVFTEYKTINEGEFRFNDLSTHIECQKSPKVITIGEDATRVISRVEYDCKTDRCVGFVLPLDEQGLPKVDSFLAVSFEAIERMFSSNVIAKYAYVYMATPLCRNASSFCLACLGTDNKFIAEDVLLKWQYIVNECEKRDIHVLSFGGDGDSRVLKAMRVSSGLHVTKLTRLPAVTILPPQIPSSWLSWFHVQQLIGIAYVQDVVHIAVKLKSRLISPSIVLPMGSYVAGAYHLRIVQMTFGKDQHGLRERDIDHKDKQNFPAVMNIIRAAPLLDKIPDAVATKQFVDIIQGVVDSFLCLDLDPISRIRKIWCALLFLRYWRQWVLNSHTYTLKDNFITPNAYMCVEINAHALLIFLLMVRDHFKDMSMFLPWLLGSQSCEKAFRSVRSMSSTFSTMINFGILGLLRRLHRLQIQTTLQGEADKNEIVYPQLEKHKCKDGVNEFKSYSLCEVSDTLICEAVCQAKADAKSSIQKLGMYDSKLWTEFEDSNGKEEIETEQEDEDDEEEEENEDQCENVNMSDELLIDSIVSEVCSESHDDLESDINALSGVIDMKVEAGLRKRRKLLPKKEKLPSNLPMYTMSSPASNSPFLQVHINSKDVYIRKTTAIWLFQEGERVSSDRLFRVRAKQPYSSEVAPLGDHCVVQSDFHVPIVSAAIKLGELCAFKFSTHWKIGRVLQFAKLKEKSKSARQFKGLSADVSQHSIGVLCSWFSMKDEKSLSFCTYSDEEVLHSYLPLSSYICSLTTGCFEVVRGITSENQNTIMPVSNLQQCIATAEEIKLTIECEQFITSNAGLPPLQQSVKDEVESGDSEGILVLDDEGSTKPKKGEECKKWMTSPITLFMSDKEVLQKKHGWLNDQHATVAQLLLKQQFPHIGGLQSTVLQENRSQSPLRANSLQIVWINENHWITISTIGCTNEDVICYDSLHSPITADVQTVLARLLFTSKPTFQVKLAKVTRQSGTSDCGLFAIAYITHLAFGQDPALFTFSQDKMREHLIQCIERGVMHPFPVLKSKRPTEGKVIEVKVFCYCRCPESKTMVACDGDCLEWFHIECVASPVKKKDKWFCNNCSH